MKKIKPLKAKLWKLFSEYIRLRDADSNGMVSCVTCDSSGKWQGDYFQAGHFLGGRNNGILFVEECCHAQCSRCNRFPDSMTGKRYYDFMLKEYGLETIEELQHLKKNPPKLDSEWYEKEIEIYKEKVEFQKMRIGIK